MNVNLYAVSNKNSYKQAHLHVQEPTYFFIYISDPVYWVRVFIKNVVLPLIYVTY